PLSGSVAVRRRRGDRVGRRRVPPLELRGAASPAQDGRAGGRMLRDPRVDPPPPRRPQRDAVSAGAGGGQGTLRRRVTPPRFHGSARAARRPSFGLMRTFGEAV